MARTLPIVLSATDTSTGEDIYIQERIPATGDENLNVADAMDCHPGYEFSGWEYDYKH